MIDAIIDWSARRRWIVIAATVVLVIAGVWCMKRVPLDAIPDLSDTQVIIYTEWPGRSPDLIEDQITYPLVSSMLGSPRVHAVRGLSDYGYSWVYVIFDEGTDLYWARSRVLESLSSLGTRMPEGVTPKLGPDGTGVGWAFEYALVDRGGRHSLMELRQFNDWTLRSWLQSVPGVAEVATVGGFVRQWQVTVDPTRLAELRIPISEVIEAVRRSNVEVGARSIELSGAEHVIRGRGYLLSLDDLRLVPLGGDVNAPTLLGQVARIEEGPQMRRGIAELNGAGEVTGGIVVVRQDENVLAVIERVKARIAEVAQGFPEGVELVPTYDRSELIHRAIGTLLRTLLEELLVVSLVILIFLRHPASAAIPIVTIPVAVILAFIPINAMGLSSNIMSLAGIAIAIGALVDASIVVVEQVHVKLARWQAAGRPGPARDVVIEGVKEVGGASFWSLLVIAVAFLPIFALQAQEGRLFKPLAFTKNAAMAIAAVLAITLDPALRLILTRVEPFTFRPRRLASIMTRFVVGGFEPEEKSRITRGLMAIYRPALHLALRHRFVVLAAAFLSFVAIIPVWRSLGSEFMPPLNEGSILYMPTTLPGLGPTEAARWLKVQDALLKQFPEVRSVFGKIGKAETATDPAPMSMVETTVILEPRDRWRKTHAVRWYSSWAPETLARALRRVWPEERARTWDELIDEMDRTVRLPGFANAWLFPVKTRIDMTTTGIRTPIGVKIMGPDLEVIDRLGLEVEAVMQELPGTRSAFFERLVGGRYLDIRVDRARAARIGLSVGDVNDVVEAAIGGAEATTVVSGRERWSVLVRYPRDLRDDVEAIGRVLVATPSGAHVPLSEVASLRLVAGPAMIRNEDGFLAGIVFVDIASGDLGGYVKAAKQAVAAGVQLPPGYRLAWGGQWQYAERARLRLLAIVPLTLLVIVVLLWINTGSLAKTSIILLAVPFSAIGAVLLLWALDYNVSVATWVGLIALLGVDAETGVFMLLYLDIAIDSARKEGRLNTAADLLVAIEEGAVRRLRPKVMTVTVMFAGLLPIMWSTGTGSDVMRRIAAPIIGGLVTSFLLELLVYPVIYDLWQGRRLRRG